MFEYILHMHKIKDRSTTDVSAFSHFIFSKVLFPVQDSLNTFSLRCFPNPIFRPAHVTYEVVCRIS